VFFTHDFNHGFIIQLNKKRLLLCQQPVYVLAMVGHLKNVSPTFAQMPNRITNVEFTTVSPTIANTMLYDVLF
jgi:hypothetical protein